MAKYNVIQSDCQTLKNEGFMEEIQLYLVIYDKFFEDFEDTVREAKKNTQA